MKIISVIVSLLITTSSVCFADSPGCEQQLNYCQQAYDAHRILIKDQKEQINNYFKKDQLQRQIIADREAELTSPFHDPFIVGGVAMIATMAVMIITGHIK